MEKVRVAINGFGRIGRSVFREAIERNKDNIEIVALNNPGNLNVYAHLLQYDSVHGMFNHPVDINKGVLSVGKRHFHFFQESEPGAIPWPDLDVDIVIDATGVFKDKNTLGRHLRGTVKKVLLCSPGKDLDNTVVMGINQDTYKPDEHHILSNASCTTNCLAPIAKIIEDNWGIENGFMTTIHSYTSDQRLLDHSHYDFRRARSAGLSIIPTTTGAAKSLGKVIPELNGKLDGYAVRVPTPNVSLVDLTVTVKNETTVNEVNNKMKEASEGFLKGILGFNPVPLVSTDFNGNRHSSIFDSTLTNQIGKNLKVVSWYDNEIGFSNRVLDLASFVGKSLR